MSFFFISVTLILWGMTAAIMGWLAWAFPALPRRIVVLVLPIMISAFIIFGITYTRAHYHAGTDLLYYASYILFGCVFIAFCVAAGCAFLHFILWICRAPRAWLGPASVLLIVSACAVAVWGGFRAPPLKIIPISSPKLPKLKIALLSDTHLGRGVSLARFDDVMNRLQAEQPDVLFVLGDIFEYGQNRAAYAARIRQFSAPLGKYGVLGNHEYYVGYENSLKFYKDSGLTLLQNGVTELSNGVQVAGVSDIQTTRLTPPEIVQRLQQADPAKPLIFLSHIPTYTEEIAAAGTDLMFSGHTHNGQIWPFTYLVKSRFARMYGLFNVSGMYLYVTSGVFYWGMPMRLFASSELPIVEVN